MPLHAGTSQKVVSGNIRTLMHDIGKSPHVQSREQAIAIAMSKARESGRKHKVGGGPTGTGRRIPQDYDPADDPRPATLDDMSRSDDENPQSSLQTTWPMGVVGRAGYDDGGPVDDDTQDTDIASRIGGPGVTPYQPPPRQLTPDALMRHAQRPSTTVDQASPGDIVAKLKMFYDHYGELRPDQQKRLMEMLGQPLDRPAVGKPTIDWDELQRSHDFNKALREQPQYHPPYRGAAGGGSVDRAVHLARQLADGGDAPALPLTKSPADPAAAAPFEGPIISHVPGRTDKIKLDVAPGSYVWPADVTSILGESNSLAGQNLLGLMFSAKKLRGGIPAPRGRPAPGMPSFGTPHVSPKLAKMSVKAPSIVPGMKPPKMPMHAAQGGYHMPQQGMVPIIAAGGEYVVPPHEIIAKFGDLDTGHQTMDHVIKLIRDQEMARLKTAPPPKT